MVISEITEQVEQRRSLESASRSYQALAENSGLGLALCRTVYDAEGKAVDFEFVEVNRLHRAFTGLPPEEVVGRKVSEVIPGFPQDLIDLQNQVALSGEPREEEIYEPHLGRWYRLNLYSPEPGYFVSLFADITAEKAAGSERKRAEEAQWESEERFRSVFTSNVTALALWHTDGRLLEANDRFLEVIGYSRSEFEAGEVRWVEATPPDMRQRDQDAVKALVAGEDIEPYEKEFEHPDGTRVPVLIGGSMLRGSAEMGVAFAIDITERKAAEEALRSSEKTFAELIERSPFGTYVVDSEFRIAFMNASSQTGAFRNVRPLIGRPFTEAMHTLWPDDVAEDIISHFRHTLETGEPYYSPRFTNPRHDVEMVESYEWELQRIALPDGQWGVICYYFDSSDLRAAQAALQENEERLRLVLDNSLDGINLLDLSTGRYTIMNPAQAAMTGFSMDELNGMSAEEAYDRVHPDDRLTSVEQQKRVAAGEGGAEPVEYRWRVKSGEYRWFSDRRQVVRDKQGQPVALVGISRDITERKQAEEALRASEERYRRLAEENERLYRQQLDIAENLQAAFLHIPSELGPVRLGHLYRSATEAARVGGDFYDVFEVKEARSPPHG